MSFLTFRHPQYEERRDRSTFAHLYRTGEVQEKAEEAARKDRGTRIDAGDLHLQRRSQGETMQAYRERVYVSRYPRHMGRIVTSFVGSLMQSDKKASRQWGDTLGSPEDDDTQMSRYFKDADGEGTGMKQLLQNVADTLVTSHRQWYLVDPPSGDSDLATVNLIPEKRVINWVTQGGRLVDVLVKEHRDPRTSIEDETEAGETFIRYRPDGWTRYREEDGDPVVIGEGEWEFPFYQTADRDERRLPIGYVDLGLEEPVGYRIPRSRRPPPRSCKTSLRGGSPSCPCWRRRWTRLRTTSTVSSTRSKSRRIRRRGRRHRWSGAGTLSRSMPRRRLTN